MDLKTAATVDDGYCVYRDLKIEMRDGITLSADLFLPAADGAPQPGPFSTIMIRTPYNEVPPDVLGDARYRFAKAGYAVLVQGVRGTDRSEGILEPLVNESWGEKQDGVDTVAWILQQTWSDGRVGGYGASYLGGVQLTLLTMDVPGFETGFVQVPAVNKSGFSWVYHGGMLDLQTTSFWPVLMADVVTAKRPELKSLIAADEAEAGVTRLEVAMDLGRVPELLRGRSLRDALILRHFPFWQRWLDGRDHPTLFANTDALSRLDRVTKPAMHMTGWYDLFLPNSIDAYTGISRGGATLEARDGQRLWIGPWGHTPNPGFRQFPDARVDDLAATIAWTDQQFYGKHDPIFDHPVLLYVMGENRWRAEESWPVAGVEPKTLYLQSDGDARSASGSGKLALTPPVEAREPDRYRYDPADPAPTLGGRGVLAGPVDQASNQSRLDTLVYTTPPLEEDMEVTGAARVTLYASSSATDTDWFAKLVDVFPTGESYNLGAGAVRARYRQSRSEPRPLVPGEIVKYELELTPTSNVFKKGHRIRLIISSSDFPESDLNPNSFVDISAATAADYVVAEQAIFLDKDHASSIELPVVPASRPREWIAAPFGGDAAESYYLKAFEVPAEAPAPVELNAIGSRE